MNAASIGVQSWETPHTKALEIRVKLYTGNLSFAGRKLKQHCWVFLMFLCFCCQMVCLFVLWDFRLCVGTLLTQLWHKSFSLVKRRRSKLNLNNPKWCETSHSGFQFSMGSLNDWPFTMECFRPSEQNRQEKSNLTSSSSTKSKHQISAQTPLIT